MALKLDKNLYGFVTEQELCSMQGAVDDAVNKIKNKTGAGSEYLGWVDLPVTYDREEFERIKTAAEEIKKCDVFIVIGIGGSYLGARAAIEFIKSPLYNTLKKDTPDIYFAGNNISTSALNELLEICEGKDICINVISKSGKTTEPAIAFRIFRKYLIDKYGEAEANKRIYVTTDKAKGALKTLASKKENGYESFVVPDDIGGRYSVLSAVGLLPIAVAGIDIDAIMNGALQARNDLYCGPSDNDCYRYAAIRNILYNKNKVIEILASYDSALIMTAEWWKQLFGESEGKDGKGIFPASVTFTTDLHSLGQIIQAGKRNIFETVIFIKDSDKDIFIENDADDLDELNYISKQYLSLHDINKCAFRATVMAHVSGGVPNILFELDSRDAANFGYMVYFFELACAVSGYMLGVNPFDQPGVEEYKNNMFELLGKNKNK